MGMAAGGNCVKISRAEYSLTRALMEGPVASDYRRRSLPTSALAARRAYARTCNNLGILLSSLNRRAEARTFLERGLILQAQLATDFPQVPHYRRELARSFINVAVLLQRDRRPVTETEPYYRDALRLFERLAQDFPGIPDYRHELGQAYTNLAISLRVGRRLGQALDAFRQALTIQQKLAADFPSVPDYRQKLARVYLSLGNCLADSRRREEAGRAYREALKLFGRLARASRGADDHDGLAVTGCALARLLPGKARQLLQAAADAEATALRLSPHNTNYARHYQTAVALLLARGGHAEAARAAERLLEIYPASGRAGACAAAARWLARCVPLAARDASLLEADRRQLGHDYGDRAVKLLRQALDKGYPAAEVLKEASFKPLCGRPDFPRLPQPPNRPVEATGAARR